MWRRLLLPIVAFVLAGTAWGMDFTKGQTPGGVTYVIAEGVISAADAEKFRLIARTQRLANAILVLDSDGGSIRAGIDIGLIARHADMETMVPPRGHCLSACLLAFVGGTHRDVARDAELGSHQFYWEKEDNRSSKGATAETQSIAAAIIQHLSVMGIDPEALSPIMSTPSDGMYVFSRFELEQYDLIGDRIDRSKDGAIIMHGGPSRPGCPFPEGSAFIDAMHLYPQCY